MSYVIHGLRVENSRSRSGKHVLYSGVFVYRKDHGLLPYTKYTYTETGIKPIYAKGEAKDVSIKTIHGDFIVYFSFVKNYKNTVKGYIQVFNHRGELVYRAKYRNGYLVKSRGDPIYAWLIRLFVDITKIPIKEIKLGDER